MVAKNVGAVVEEWRPIAGYEGRYEVSNLGRVRSLWQRWNVRGHAVVRERIKVLRPGSSRTGYLRVQLYGDVPGGRTYLVHRLVANAFCPRHNADELDVNHRNGVRSDARAENLEWCTKQANARHAFQVLRVGDRRRVSGGAIPGCAKLTPKAVLRIREIAATNVLKVSEIARLFGVSYGAVKMIIDRESWTDL